MSHQKHSDQTLNDLEAFLQQISEEYSFQIEQNEEVCGANGDLSENGGLCNATRLGFTQTSRLVSPVERTLSTVLANTLTGSSLNRSLPNHDWYKQKYLFWPESASTLGATSSSSRDLHHHSAVSNSGPENLSQNSEAVIASHHISLFYSHSQASTSASATNQTIHPLLARHFRYSNQSKERDLLIQVIYSGWFERNEPEPRHLGKSILLGFFHRLLPNSPLCCSFDECDRTFDRQDRAIAHIRQHHLGRKPYQCAGACGKQGCQDRFSNPAYLRGHINKTKAPCTTCGKELSRKNLSRHKASCGN